MNCNILINAIPFIYPYTKIIIVYSLFINVFDMGINSQINLFIFLFASCITCALYDLSFVPSSPHSGRQAVTVHTTFSLDEAIKELFCNWTKLIFNYDWRLNWRYKPVNGSSNNNCKQLLLDCAIHLCYSRFFFDFQFLFLSFSFTVISLYLRYLKLGLLIWLIFDQY